jgi:hypothetical protein
LAFYNGLFITDENFIVFYFRLDENDKKRHSQRQAGVGTKGRQEMAQRLAKKRRTGRLEKMQSVRRLVRGQGYTYIIR